MRLSPLLAALSPALIGFVAHPAAAQALADPVSIDRAVEDFTGRRIGEMGGALHPVDRRLRLAQCPVALTASWHGEPGRSVVVRCPSGTGWRVFVAVTAGPSASSAPAVARGEAVAIVIQGQGFTLSRKGEALEAGAIGQWIRVRPVSGDKGNRTEPVRMQVMTPGTVGMDLP